MTIQYDFCGDSGKLTTSKIMKVEASFCFDVHGFYIHFMREGKSSKIFCTSFEIIG